MLSPPLRDSRRKTIIGAQQFLNFAVDRRQFRQLRQDPSSGAIQIRARFLH
jgi:hypothetical protein